MALNLEKQLRFVSVFSGLSQGQVWLADQECIVWRLSPQSGIVIHQASLQHQSIDNQPGQYRHPPNRSSRHPLDLIPAGT